MPGSPPGWSWERYRHVADTSVDVVCETDSTGLLVWVQPTVSGLLGWEPTELLGVQARDLVHPDDMVRALDMRSVVHRGDEPGDIDVRFRTRDGRYRECRVRARPLTGRGGEVSGIVLVLRDVHRQTAVLRALATLSRANEELVRAADEDQLLQRMCDTVAETGLYPLAWFGRPQNDDARTVRPVAVAGPHADYLDRVAISWGDGPLGQGPVGTAVRTAVTQVRNDLGTDPDFRPWLAPAELHGFACAVALPVLVDGVVDGVLGVYAEEPGSFDDLALSLLEDLTADLGFGLTRLRDGLRLQDSVLDAEQSARRLRATLDSLIDPFVLLESVRDADGRLIDLLYVDANDAAVAYNRMPRDQLLGSTMLELFPGLFDRGPLADYFAAIETGEAMILDDVLYENEMFGAARWYDLRGVKNGDGMALTWRDVTERRLAAEELAASQADYRLLAENASDFVLRSRPDGTIDWASPSASRALGYDPEEIVGRHASDLVHPDHHDRSRRANERLALGEIVHDRVLMAHKDGTYVWYEFNARPVLDDEGAVVSRVSSWRHVDAEVAAQAALTASETLFRTAMEESPIGMALADLDGRFRVVNDAMCELVGRDEPWLLSHTFPDLVHQHDLAAVLGDRAAMIAGEIPSSKRQHRMVKSDGSTIWVRRSGVVIRDVHDRADFIMVQLDDVTNEHAAREKLDFQAFHDEATGLQNRSWVMAQLATDLEVAQREGRGLGVLFLDLDNFKVVNDSLGHAAGDELLRQVGVRLSDVCANGFRLGRFGGDEFLVVVPRLTDGLVLEGVARRLSAAVALPLVLGEHRIVTSASIGMTVSDPTSTPASLLRDTDAALFRAKAAGRSRHQLFDGAMHAEAVSRLTVEDDLRRGLVQHELVPYFQPVIDLRTREVVGHEALVRWLHPERGVLAPAAFLAVAEESGLVVEVGRDMLEQVCARIATSPDLTGTVSVNVSAVQLTRIDWAEGVLDAIARHGVAPERLLLEVTETAVLALLDSTRDDLRRLREHGVGLYVDDFGTGYSSIALLRELPVTGLKLDRSFVSDLTIDDSSANALSQGLASLARSLHLDGVAEGVETREQAAILRMHGWPHGQGYLFGRPEPEPLAADALLTV